MPIRTLPLSQITEAVLVQMKDDDVQEDTTLDFKRELALDGKQKLSKPGKLKFLEDVTALANASGGVVLYGAEEGKGGQRGQIIGLPGMDIDPDPLVLWLGQLLMTQVDEPLWSVDMHPIRVGPRHCLVVRVPVSPLAPHMIKLPANESDRARFYMRTGAASPPMTARQIKEVAMRSETAIERVESRIAERLGVIQALLRGRPDDKRVDCVAVHVMPLHGNPNVPDLTSDAVISRVHAARPFGEYVKISGYGGRIGLDGLASEAVGQGVVDTWTLLLRGGGLEFVSINRAWQDHAGNWRIDGDKLEKDIVGALEQAKALAADGLVSLPIVLSLRLLNVPRVVLDKTSQAGRFTESAIIIPTALVSRWEDLPPAITGMFNVVWQASGVVRSPYETAQNAVAAGKL